MSNRHIFSIFAYALICIVSSEILYLQEDSAIYDTNSSGASSITLSTLNLPWTQVQKFGISCWVNKINWSSMPSFDTFFQVSNDPNDYYNDGRVLLSSTRSDQYTIFQIATAGDGIGNWYPWEGNSTAGQMFPVGEWVFISLSIDAVTNTQYGFRYYPDPSTNTIVSNFASLTPTTGNLYVINPSTTIYWGGDNSNLICNCNLHYVRFYIGYSAESRDEMINLAIMNSQGTLYEFHFQSDPDVSNNQTMIVYYTTNVTEGALVSIKVSNTIWDPVIGPWNILECRPGTYMSFYTGESNVNGIVVALDVKFYSNFSGVETIFSIRDTVNNFISLVAEFWTTNVRIYQQRSDGSFSNIFTSSLVQQDNWNHIVFELDQVEPTNFGVGFCSGRMWLNGVNSSFSYFCNFSSGYTLFQDMNNVTIELCSKKNNGSPNTRESSRDSYSDVMNFVWIKGTQRLFVNQSDPTCALSGFLSPEQTFCVECNPGYVMVDTTCENQCPSDHFLHKDTNSCQKCEYGTYFTVDGYCVNCDQENQVIVGSACFQCDMSCKECKGPASNECISCYSGSYFFEDNSTCGPCNNNAGFYIENSTFCRVCDSSCKTCQGPTAFDCLSCASDKILVSDSCQKPIVFDVGRAASAVFEAQVVTTSILPILLSSASTTALILIDFMSDIVVYRFINVAFPDNFAAFMKMLEMSFLPNLFNLVHYESNTLPFSIGKFEEYQIPIAFLQNFGDKLDREILAIMLIVITVLSTTIFKRFPKSHNFFRNLRDKFMWNLLLTYYLGDFTEILLYSIIQFKGNQSDSWYTWCNFGLCVILLTSYGILFAYFGYLLNRKKSTGGRSNQHANQKDEDTWVEAPARINAISKDFKKNNRFNRNFILFLALENSVDDLIVTLFQDHGVFQAGFYTAIKLVFLIIIILVSRPFTSRFQNVIFGINCGFKAIMGISAIFLAYNQSKQILSAGNLQIFGYFMIGLITSAIVLNAFFAIIELFWGVFWEIKQKKKRAVVVPLSPSLNAIPGTTSSLSLNNLDMCSMVSGRFNFASASSSTQKMPSFTNLHEDSDLHQNNLGYYIQKKHEEQMKSLNILGEKL